MSRPVYPDQIQESSTLDLANECSRFVTGYFDIINVSAPHIYHSALVLTPKTSIVRKLYGAHARPFVRVVHGELMSWGPNTATTTRPVAIRLAVWSQCSRFIAITQSYTAVMVDILDSATLQRLQTLEPPQGISTSQMALAFSPDSRMLTCYSGSSYDPDENASVVSWDIQTGGIVSVIRWQELGEKRLDDEIPQPPSITYSTNGKLVGVCYWYFYSAVISIHDVISGVHIHSHLLGSPFANGNLSPDDGSALDGGSVDVSGSMVSKNNLAPNDGPVSNKGPVSVSSAGQISHNIWTHGEFLRFATVGPTTITIWEVGFTSETPPTEVETLSVSDSVRSAIPPNDDYDDLAGRVQFLPTSCRLGIVDQGKVLVWDARNSKSLLSQTDTRCHPGMSFSADGRFFACSTTGYEVHLWKESSTGYVLHGTLVSSTGNSSLLLSPNGESIITFGDGTVRLWHTKGFTAPPSSVLARAPLHSGDFILDFSPDRMLVMVARREDSEVTVLDLRSGALQLTIDASTSVYGLRVMGDTVVVVGDGKVVTWNLPAANHIPNASVKVTGVIDFMSPEGRHVFAASTSSDLHHVAFVTHALWGPRYLHIYSAPTKKYLGSHSTGGNTPWFTLDGRSVWCARGTGEAEVWTVTGHGPVQPPGDPSVDIEHPPEGYPWRSSRGYRATDDCWVLGPDGKRLLMLPPPWRSYPGQRVWNGRFLALLHGALPEPVILELDS